MRTDACVVIDPSESREGISVTRYTRDGVPDMKFGHFGRVHDNLGVGGREHLRVRDARFQGSMGGRLLNAPVQSLVSGSDGSGCWLVAADGGVFAFDAPFRWSMGGARLNRPVTGMVRFGGGYLMVDEDGGIFSVSVSVSDRALVGSLGASPPPSPVASAAAPPDACRACAGVPPSSESGAMTVPRLDAVEIKVTIGPSAMDLAMHTLGLDPESGTKRRIWFCEVPPSGAGGGAPVLLGQGVILRLRATEGKDADSTVKIRPMNPPPLAVRWREVEKVAGGELRVEGDWVGSRHIVSASLVTAQGDDEPARAAAGRRPLTRLFSQDQEDFLRDHARHPVDLDGLRAFGPIAAVKWEPRDRGLPHHLAAEHWRVDELQFLELSVRSDDPAAAEDVQERLNRALEERGLLADVVQETKTRTVLEHLLGRPA